MAVHLHHPAGRRIAPEIATLQRHLPDERDREHADDRDDDDGQRIHRDIMGPAASLPRWTSSVHADGAVEGVKRVRST